MELMMEKRTDLDERSMKNLRITENFQLKEKKKKKRDENAEERSNCSLKVS